MVEMSRSNIWMGSQADIDKKCISVSDRLARKNAYPDTRSSFFPKKFWPVFQTYLNFRECDNRRIGCNLYQPIVKAAILVSDQMCVGLRARLVYLL